MYRVADRQPTLALEQFQKVIDLTDSAADRMPALRTSAFAHMSFAYNKLGDYANQQKYLTMAAQQHESEVYTPLPPRAAKP